MTSIKGHNSVANLQKMTSNISNLDLVNINAYTKFSQILSICFKDIERKRNSGIYQGPKMTGNNPNLDLVKMNAYIKFGEIL